MPGPDPVRPGGRPRPDDGYFPRGTSMLRRVHEERRVGLMFGQRALVVGAIKPRNYVGTAEHSGHKADPFKRLTRTAIAFETVFLGSRAEADRVIAVVERMHRRVHGVLPQDEGPLPAGTPYDAFDPGMMVWTVAAMMDAAETMHDLLVRPLSTDERERLWHDYRRFAELFGTPAGSLPPTYAAFRAYLAAELTAPDVHLGDQARYVGWFSAFAIPSPVMRGPALAAHNLIVLGSLPPVVRELYGLEWRARDQRAFAALCASQRLARRITPDRVACGRNTGAFRAIEREEARRIRAGVPTPHLRPDGSPGTPCPLLPGSGATPERVPA